MKLHTYLTISAAVFAIIAAVHALRIVLGWEGIIGGWLVPHWVSWGAIFIAGLLAYHGLTLSQKKR